MAKSRTQEHGVFDDVTGEGLGSGLKTVCLGSIQTRTSYSPDLACRVWVDGGHEEAKQIRRRRRRPKHGQIVMLKELSTMSLEIRFT